MVLKWHVFICMLVFHVEWHLRRDLKELLFDDHEREAADEAWKSIVDKAPRSESAKRKQSKRKTADGLPVQSFQCMSDDLATFIGQLVRLTSCPETEFTQVSTPSPWQQRVFDLLKVTPGGLARTWHWMGAKIHLFCWEKVKHRLFFRKKYGFSAGRSLMQSGINRVRYPQT